MAKYDVKEVEKKILRFWDKEKVYGTDFKRCGFSIDTPPPTVSGKMHIGHAFSYAQQDFIARYRRMKEGVFYPFGTDDNGLPTERLVERLKKVRSKDMSRADFIKLCLKTLKEITPDFIQDWKDIGVSCDYDVIYSTIDDNSRKISQESFIELYNSGIAYKKEFPTLWCPECQTAIAQAELEDKERGSLFSTLKFEIVSSGSKDPEGRVASSESKDSEGRKDLLIATTRPELLGACVAVFVNPKDKRYKKYVGKRARVPIFGQEVPIVEDESAEIDKGTGVLMICSYGDKFDVDAINRHDLEPRMILGKDGKISVEGYEGLKIKEARKKILDDLRNNGLIDGQKEINHVTNVHDKCGTDVEFISTEQWFVKVLDKKKELIKQGKKINWNPKFMYKRYENWVNGLEWDWSISRDRHFGVPIPVWNCGCGEVVVAKVSELPVDPLQVKKKCGKCKKDMKGESKVLDTWMTSSMTPKIASSLVDGKVKVPYSLRPQAHDIIRTWAFYTIIKSMYHEKKIPWEDVVISGVVTLGKEKMSKSKGNSIDPRKVIDEYGADALRFWAAGSKLGGDLDYQEQDLVAGKKLLNKLVNASRFVFMNLEDWDGKKPARLEKIDSLFLDRVDELVEVCSESFEKYEYSQAKLEVERFFFKMFADNYLEIVKKRVYTGKGLKKKSAQYALYSGLLVILKLFAPIVPFVCEEIYLEHFKKSSKSKGLEKDKSIHVSKWPESGKVGKSEEFDLFLDVLSRVRQEKTNAKKAMNSEIKLTLSKKDLGGIGEMVEDLKDVVNAVEVSGGKFGVGFV
jgi:valyl-tRNA synthetase